MGIRECDVCDARAVDESPDGEVLCEAHARMKYEQWSKQA